MQYTFKQDNSTATLSLVKNIKFLDICDYNCLLTYVMIKGYRYLPAVNILVCFCWFRNAFQWPTKPLNFHRHMSHEKYSIHEIVNNSKHENLNKEYCFRVNNTKRNPEIPQHL